MIGSKYRLGERLGTGGMAEVFRATVTDAQGRERAVAVKRLLPGQAADPKMRAMLGREAQIMARVQHPNLVALLDLEHDQPGGHLRHLVLELVDGTTLDRLARNALLPLPVVLHIMTELLTGLAHLHALADAHGRALEHRPVYPRSRNRGFVSHRCVAPRSLGDTQLPRRALRCLQLHDFATLSAQEEVRSHHGSNDEHHPRPHRFRPPLAQENLGSAFRAHSVLVLMQL